MSEFIEFPKIARLSRECVVTEKIDGTNAQIIIERIADRDAAFAQAPVAIVGEWAVSAGSRTRYIHHVTGDNFGFAAWVHQHADELLALGEGRHFGEWWGSGIQRGYGLQTGEKRFSLFNVARWHQAGNDPYVSVSGDPRVAPKMSSEAPQCCHVVPVLYRGPFCTVEVGRVVERLAEFGSSAAPGFIKPEGVVVFHTASGQMFKKTIEKDDEPKSRAVA